MGQLMMTRRNLAIAGVILNDADGLDDTLAGKTNFAELANRTDVPVLGIVGRGGQSVSLRDQETPARIDWSELAGSRKNKAMSPE